MKLLLRLRSELTGLPNLFFPPACPLCGDEFGSGSAHAFCPACLSDLPPLRSPCCPRCALPYPTEGGTDHLCESCLRDDPPFAWVAALGTYRGLLREAVHRFKYQGAIGLDRPLARLLAKTLEERRTAFGPDLIIPVPLHRNRLRERTFNQSQLLARRLARYWQVPAPANLLIRQRPTSSQQGLKADLRRRNLKGAFAMSRRLSGEKVLLIDDVMTTGTTARECADTLLAGGAATVAVAVLGRAPRH